MADEEDQDDFQREKSKVEDVVSKVTVKALQEFDVGELPPEEEPRKTSRPPSGRVGSRTGSRAGSGRPESARPGSKAGSRPGSAAGGSPAAAAAGSRKSSGGGRGSRPPSATAGSVAERLERLSLSGSRPTSGQRDRPASGAERPPSGQQDEFEFLTDDTFKPLDLTSQPSQPPEESDAGPGGTGMELTLLPGDEGGSEDEEEDEEDMEEEGDDDLGSEGSDEESEMVVLDPDHPLMRRFQKALKDQLQKQDEKVTLELRELTEALKNRKGERENLGVELYGLQQELARHQMMLEKNHDQYTDTNQTRSQIEQQLGDIRSMYKENQTQFSKDKKRSSELQAEVENIALRLFYMDSAKEDVRSDISVMRRAAEKADSEVAKAEIEKQKQDLLVDRLVERVDKLREEISMFEAQITAQQEETRMAKDALSEAYMEIESITLEKKQLFQQWNSSLIGMRRRDEAHAAMSEALNQQQQKILSLETEIDGYKRSISKEQENNEKLMLVLNKTESDIATVKKMLAQCQAKHEALKAEYATYTRMLHETEQALNRANTDKTLKINEMNMLRKQIEKEYREKVKLEDEIMERLRSQLTLDKAAQYTDKLTGKTRARTKDLESQLAEVENHISRDTLECSNIRTRIERISVTLRELDEEIARKNEIITKSDNEIIKRNAVIERKQNVIDQYNKKLEQMISTAGGAELGPLEIQINSLQKSIDAEIQEIAEMQQMWLREQSELVQLSKEKDKQSADVDTLKKQLTILSQRKIRTEGSIDTERKEILDLERNIRNMQNDMLKMNSLLYSEKGRQHGLQQGNVLMENDFIGALKEAELESIQMQAQLQSLKEEKERLLNSLVEAERQIMLWEKKTQLARETREAVDGEVGQGEMKAMRAEIHRMQVRYTQLMKQQERMIQEMEKAVSRRDTIVTRGDAQTKTNKKVVTKGSFQRQLAELRKKIKQTISDANQCDSEIKEYRDHQQGLSHNLEEKQINCQQLQTTTDTLDEDIERLAEQKARNMADLLAKQQKAKYFQQVKDGRYTRLCKSDAALEQEMTKQTDRMQTLSAIVDRLNQEFPHVQPALRKVTLSLGTRGLPTDLDDL